MATRIQLRRDTASNWTSVNPTLAEGELGYETDTGKVKLGTGSTAWASLGYYYFTVDLADLSDVTITSAADGDFLRWNGSAWINDAVNLGTDSVGDYVESLVAGTGITLSNNTGEGATPTISIGQSVDTTDNVTFNNVTLTGTLIFETVNGGVYDLTFGTETLTDNRTVQFPNESGVLATYGNIELGTDTVGNYVSDVSGGTGVSVSHTPGEGSTPTVSIGQPVASTDSPTFAGLTLTGSQISFEGNTDDDFETTINVEDPTADRTISFPDSSGVVALEGQIDLGTDTTGNYVSDVSGGTGVTVTHTPGEGSTPSVAIGQAVGTTDNVTFNVVTGDLIGDVYASNGTNKVLENGTDGTDATFTGDVTGDLIGDVKSTNGTTVLDSGTDGTNATFTGDVTGNASTASALETSRTIELTGDVTGSVSFDGSANVQISTTVSADSTVLGTDTTGDYVESLTAGTGVTVTGGTGEGSTPSVAIGQAVGTTDNVTFNSVAADIVGDVYASNGTSKILESGTDGTDATFTGDVTGDLTGNADTASTLATGRTIELTGDVTGSVSFDGSANVEISTTIAADSVALGTDTTGSYVESLVAGTGITLANNSGESATPTVSIGQAVGTTDSVTFANVTVSNSPTQASHAATKSYVDNVAAGIDWHQAVKLATAAALPNSPTYSNGTSGVGATLTATAYARLTIDGANATTGDRVLVKDQSTAAHNGIYDVTEQGNGTDTYWVLTRATDFDSSPTNEIKSGEAVFVLGGSSNIRQGFVLTSTGTGTAGAHVLNTDDLSFTQFTGTSAFTAGDGISQSGNTLNVGTASTGRIIVNTDNIDLATVGQTDTSGANTTSFVSSVTIDSYGRVTGQETSDIDFSDTALTGTPTAPTASVGTSTTQVATTAFVDAEISDQAVLKSVVDAKGDIIVASGADAVTRLAVGTDGYYLKSNSSAANGVEWAAITETIGAGDLTDVVLTSVANGQILQYDGTNWVNTVQAGAEPIGHENRADSTISFDNSTQTFTIEPASTSFTVWCKGKRFVKSSAQTVVIGSTTGLYYIYFNTSGVLSYRTSYFDWENDTPTAYIYWNATTSKAEFFADERHGVVLDWQTHEYLHRTRGAAIAGGFGASGYVIDGDGSLDSHAQIALAGGTFFDEDLQVDITHAASPTANSWEQILEGTAEIPVFYRSNGAWVKDTATTFPLKQGSARPQYNLNSGGSWSTTDVQNNRYFCTWLVATNNLNEPVLAILGQSEGETQSDVEERTFDNVDLEGFPVFEFRPLYKLIYLAADSFTNTVNAVLRGVTDIRQTISAGTGVPSQPVSDHGTLTGLADDDHTQYVHITDSRANISANIATTGTITAASLGTNSNVVFEGSTVDDFETTLAATDPTADRTITLPDASGTVAILGTISLGTDTTGNYMSDVSAGTGISVTHTPSEGSTATVALNASIDDLTDVSAATPTTGHVLTYNGSAWEPQVIAVPSNSVTLGTDTSGDYVESLVAGTGVTLSNNSGEAATPTVAIGQAVGTSDTVTFAGATIDAIQVGVTDANEIDTSSGNLTIDSAGGTVTVDDNLVVSGDLTVNGTTVTVNSTVTTVDDPVMTLGGDTAPASNDAKDRGVEFRWHDGTNAKVGFFGYDDSTGRFTFIPDATNTSEVFSGTAGVIDVSDVYISGTASTGTGGVVRATDPALAGTPTAPTASVGDSTTQIATTAFVDAEIGDQAILNADIVATGDLIVGASAGTPAILSAGTDGYFLKSNSGATNGVEWASIPTINNLDDVGDVNAPTPSDGQFLKYVSASSEWQAADIPTINAIDDVGDVTITSVSDNDVLRYDSGTSNWVNDSLSDFAKLASPTFTGSVVLPADTLLPERYSSLTANTTVSIASHQNYAIEVNSASAVTITIPAAASEDFPVGTVFTFIRVGSGEVTISPDTGVTINTAIGSRLRVQWSTATLRKRASDTWLLSGDLKV